VTNGEPRTPQATRPTRVPPAPTPAADADPRVALLTTQLKKARYRPDALIDLLHVAQDIYGYLSRPLLARLADELSLPPSKVLGVATFYHLFRFDPPGDHTCTVCTGTACFVKGADALVATVGDELGVPLGGTRSDGRVSLLEARCLGSCGMAPVALVDGRVVGKATGEGLVAALREAGVGAPGEAPAAPKGGAAAGEPGSDATVLGGTA
jgi:bidirectional [NiFe] hydrogenase diaphorase subunit